MPATCSARPCTRRRQRRSNDPRGIAIDLNNIYSVDYADTSVNEVQILGGGYSSDYAAPDGGPQQYPEPLSIAVDGSFIYWVANKSGDILRVPIGSGGHIAPTVLQSGESNPVATAVDGTHVYWADHGTSVSPADGAIRQKAKDGTGSVITLAASEPAPWGLAIDANNVYWTDKTNPGSVKKTAIGSTGKAVTLAQGEGAPNGIAVDSTSVYWTDFSDNTVNKVPIAGGTKFVYAVGQNSPSAITADQKNIYWVNQTTSSGASILAVTK
jgi:sugar lactone lactonase YvrE